MNSPDNTNNIKIFNFLDVNVQRTSIFFNRILYSSNNIFELDHKYMKDHDNFTKTPTLVEILSSQAFHFSEQKIGKKR